MLEKWKSKFTRRLRRPSTQTVGPVEAALKKIQIPTEVPARHTVFPSSSPQSMFAWGSADEGQLGIAVSSEDNGLVSRPRWVPPLPESKVTKVACGYKHTLLLTSEGFVYSCGSNDFGQLGYERKTNSFARISGIQHKIRDITCGAYHSGAITQNGKVYMWGCNTNGQLGRSSEDNGVALLNFSHGPVVQVGAGYS
ncbi:Probable E3 ubiquitin-protein ligase herc4 [Sparganum proliferum]